jgi:hypothetical protein
MRYLQLLLAAIGVGILLAAPTAPAATINIGIGDQDQEVPTHYVPHGNRPGGTFVIGSEQNPEYVYETAEGRIEMSGVVDPDPSIGFTIGVTDFGAPSIFGFTIINPLAPLFSNPSVVLDSLAGGVTNAAGPNVVVTALPPPPGIPVDGDLITEMQVYTLSDNFGATYKNVGLDSGPSATFPLTVGFGATYGPFNLGPVPTIAGGPWTHMRADVNFSLSGDGDQISLTGFKLLIPEPATSLIAVFAAALIGFLRPRRQ